jgi:hypothetical protein
MEACGLPDPSKECLEIFIAMAGKGEKSPETSLSREPTQMLNVPGALQMSLDGTNFGTTY